MKPLLSICIPTYNRANVVFKCVAECLKISSDWIEFVVTDNNSSDDTINRLKTFNDDRLLVFKNEINIGYINFIKCLLNGNGKFCLLLSDEDEFINTDWEEVKELLIKLSNTAIVQYKYFDEYNNILLNAYNRLYHSASVNGLKYIFKNLVFAGGIIIRHDYLEKNWGKFCDIPYLWSLYSETVMSTSCFLDGDLFITDKIKVRRTKRNIKNYSDTKSWCGLKVNEPYWTINSRIKQLLDWMKYYKELTIDIRTKIRISEFLIKMSIFALSNYYGLLYMNNNSLLFQKYRFIIENDKIKFQNKYFIESLRIYNIILNKFNEYYGPRKRNYLIETYWIIVLFFKLFLQKFKYIVKKSG